MDIQSQKVHLKGFINPLREQTAIKVQELRSILDPGTPKNLKLIGLLSYLFDIGGIISGGAVLSVINSKPIKDVDIYFNNEEAYVKARYASQHTKKIDVCWYFNKPYELHDISYVMSTMTRDGIKTSDESKRAIDSGISELYLGNVIYPDRTAKRMMKYNKRYNVKFKLEQVLAFCSVFKIEDDVAKVLISISI
jgi:hypothetical protein